MPRKGRRCDVRNFGPLASRYVLATGYSVVRISCCSRPVHKRTPQILGKCGKMWENVGYICWPLVSSFRFFPPQRPIHSAPAPMAGEAKWHVIGLGLLCSPRCPDWASTVAAAAVCGALRFSVQFCSLTKRLELNRPWPLQLHKRSLMPQPTHATAPGPSGDTRPGGGEGGTGETWGIPPFKKWSDDRIWRCAEIKTLASHARARCQQGKAEEIYIGVATRPLCHHPIVLISNTASAYQHPVSNLP